ncbi:MAG: hypothetical protein AB1331_00325 [Bacillota bacterium]
MSPFLKLLDEERHRQWTGVSNRGILSNLEWLAEHGRRVIVRMPLVPSVNNDEANLTATGRYLASLGEVKEVHLIPYHRARMDKYRRLHRVYQLTDTPEPSRQAAERCAERLREFGLTVKTGGRGHEPTSSSTETGEPGGAGPALHRAGGADDRARWPGR